MTLDQGEIVRQHKGGEAKRRLRKSYGAVSLVLLLLIVVRIVHVNTNVLTIPEERYAQKPVGRTERCLSGNG